MEQRENNVDQLAYALITPYSLLKSRTGGIIGRLTAQPRLKLVAVRMFIFSNEFVDAYRSIMAPPGGEPVLVEAWRRYIDENLRADNPWGFLPRCVLMLFQGPDAVHHVKEDAIGSLTEQPVGDTIRGTYGDFIRNADGKIRHFEPAVITSPTPELNNEHLRLFAAYSDADGGIFTGRCKYPAGKKPETCLVMLKPDSFERPTRRPGSIVDVFSRTGLRIVGTKLFNMTVAQAEEFYGPLKKIFRSRLKGNVTDVVHARLKDAFAFPFTKVDAERVADILAERNAMAEFNRIVEYMSGVNPEEITEPQLKQTASRTKCLAMLYEGPDAIAKIRKQLGSTDPSKAEPATVRSEFGRDLMRNGAHASDAVSAAERERKIVGMWEETGDSDVKVIINEYLEGTSA